MSGSRVSVLSVEASTEPVSNRAGREESKGGRKRMGSSGCARLLSLKVGTSCGSRCEAVLGSPLGRKVVFAVPRSEGCGG